MSPTTLRERQLERARADLLQAALDVIARDGLPAVTIESVLNECGMARATLYAHFPGGRDELLRGAYERAGRELLRLAEGAASREDDWRGRILSYSRTMIEYSASPSLGHFYSVSGPHLMGFRSSRGVGSQGYFDAFRDALAEAATAGELAPGADPEALAILLASSLRDAGIALARHETSASAVMASMGLLLDGLAVHRAPSSGKSRADARD
jgi:AcrR family transcriptional regulator